MLRTSRSCAENGKTCCFFAFRLLPSTEQNCLIFGKGRTSDRFWLGWLELCTILNQHLKSKHVSDVKQICLNQAKFTKTYQWVFHFLSSTEKQILINDSWHSELRIATLLSIQYSARGPKSCLPVSTHLPLAVIG